MRASPFSGTFRGRIRKRSAICPWQRELLDGLLGADLIGFHIQAHCNNFLETVDRARNRASIGSSFAVKSRRTPHLRPAVPDQRGFRETATQPEPGIRRYVQRAALLRKLGIEATCWASASIASTTPRASSERFRGIETVSRKMARLSGASSPSCRSARPAARTFQRYHDLMVEVEAEAERINRRFQTQRLEAHRSSHAAPQPRRDSAVLPRGRFLHGHFAA